jgi:hypothetical protein
MPVRTNAYVQNMLLVFSHCCPCSLKHVWLRLVVNFSPHLWGVEVLPPRHFCLTKVRPESQSIARHYVYMTEPPRFNSNTARFNYTPLSVMDWCGHGCNKAVNMVEFDEFIFLISIKLAHT